MNRNEFKKQTTDKIDELVDIVRNDDKKDYERIKELLTDVSDSLYILGVETSYINSFKKALIDELNYSIRKKIYGGIEHSVGPLNNAINMILRAMY